jgi:hypothetical protein
MTCNPSVLKNVPLVALLDEDESAVLASQVELKTFAPRTPDLQDRRAASEIQGLARKLNLLGEKMGDVEDLLRGKPGGTPGGMSAR